MPPADLQRSGSFPRSVAPRSTQCLGALGRRGTHSCPAGPLTLDCWTPASSLVCAAASHQPAAPVAILSNLPISTVPVTDSGGVGTLQAFLQMRSAPGLRHVGHAWSRARLVRLVGAAAGTMDWLDVLPSLRLVPADSEVWARSPARRGMVAMTIPPAFRQWGTQTRLGLTHDGFFCACTNDLRVSQPHCHSRTRRSQRTRDVYSVQVHRSSARRGPEGVAARP